MADSSQDQSQDAVRRTDASARQLSSFHYAIRWFYRTVFVFLLGNILIGVLQAILVTGNTNASTLDQFQHVYIVQLALRYPIIFSIIAIIVFGLGIAGFFIDRFLARAAADLESKEQIQLLEEAVKEALKKHHEEMEDARAGTADSSAPLSPAAREDWGEAPNISHFYGRDEELSELEQWVVKDNCTIVAILGIGGVGKTALTSMLARHIRPNYDYLFWRSLQNTPPLRDIIEKCLQLLAPQQSIYLPDDVDSQISLLLSYFHTHRCLLVLDNFEAVLQSGSRAGQYRKGFEAYGTLIERIGESDLPGCFILTSREKPKEIARLEAKTTLVKSLQVRSLPLPGLHPKEVRALLSDKGIHGTEADWETLTRLYSGNPLYLQIISDPIHEVFGGDIARFLSEGEAVLGDIRDPLDWQFNRLSDAERAVMYWLAIEREPVTLEELYADILPPVSKGDLVSILDSLRRRSIIEVVGATSFTLQPVIMEHTVDQIIKRVHNEIAQEQLQLLASHSLIKAQTKDYIRQAQVRHILSPVAEKFLPSYDTTEAKRVSQRMLSIVHDSHAQEPNYAAGNLLNLMLILNIDLRGYDFSHLPIYQAYLQGAEMPEVDFASARFARTIFTDTFGGVLSVALNPADSILAAGTTTGEIRLWHFLDVTPLMTLAGHTDWVMSVAFTPDGNLLVSSSEDLTIRLWDITSGKCVKTLRGHTHWVRCIAISPDGKLIASAGEDGTTRIWDIPSGECVKILPEEARWVWSVAFHPEGKLLVNSSDDATIRVWNLETGERILSLEGHEGHVWCVTCSPDGTMIASCGQDRTIKLWDIATGRCIRTLHGHTDRVWSVTFSADGRMLASTSEDQTVRLWDIATGDILHTLQGHTQRVWSARFTADATLLISGSQDQTVRLWNLDVAECLRTVQGFTNPVTSVAWAMNNTQMASGSLDHLIRLWDAKENRLLQMLYGHTAPIRSIACSPIEPLLASASEDLSVRLWNIETGRCLHVLKGHTEWVWHVAFSPDGTQCASCGEDKVIRVWDTHSGACLHTLEGHLEHVWCVAYSPDGRQIVSCGADQTIRIWDTSTEVMTQVLHGHTNSITSVAYSPDGKMLASSGNDQLVKLWDSATGTLLATLEGHAGPIGTLTFSPDGTVLATGGSDQTIRLWDTRSNELLRILRGHTNPLTGVRYHADGTLLLSGSEDGTIRLWDVQKGNCLTTLRSDRPYERMNIAHATGLTDSQKATLRELGAIEE